VFALSNRLVIGALLGMILFGGIASMLRLKVEAYPDIADTEVVVITEYPGRAADEVEKLVTFPIERGLNNIPGLINRRSTTIFGLSVTRLTFADGVNDYFARAQVNERLKNIDLPEGTNPPSLGPLSSPVGEIYRYVIEAQPGVTVMDIRDAQDWIVIPEILRTEGVTDVTTMGGDLKQYQVVINPEMLNRYDLDISDLQKAIENNNSNTGGGVLARGSQYIPVRAIGAIHSPDDLQTVVVGERNNVPIFVRDLAQIRVGPRPYNGIVGYRFSDTADNPKGVQGIVLMLRGQNPSEVIQKLKEKTEKLNSRLKELGMRIRTLVDRSDLVSHTLTTVMHTLFEGISIVVIVIYVFLRNGRAALVTAIVIPLSLLFAFILMDFSGIPANLLSLGSIDFGIVVDGAVVAMESIIRKFNQASPEEKSRGRLHLIGSGIADVELQILVSVSIIICAYLPIFLFQRVEGKLFSPMAWTIAFALLGSLILAILAVPVISSWVFGDEIKEVHNRPLHYLEGKYRQVLAFSFKKLNLMLLILTVGVAALLSVAGFLGVEFLPRLDEGAINLRCILPSGTGLPESSRVADRLRSIIISYPEVSAVLSAAGRNDDGTDPYGPNRIETTVPLKPYETWTTGRNKDELLEDLQKKLRQEIPGARFSFSQPIIDNVSEAVTGSVADLAIILKGQDLDELRTYGIQVLNIIKQIRGSAASGIEQDGKQTQLTITMDRLAAARYGVNFSDIQNIVEMAVGGKAVSTLYQGERRYDITLRYPQERRATPDDIGSLLVRNTAGSMIPISAVAKVEFINGQSVIARKNGERIISVWTEIEGRDQGSFVSEAQQKVETEIHFPRNITVDWGGQFENLTRAGRRLMIAVPLAILIIFMILFMLFRDVRDCLLVLANVPFAITGGVLGLLIRGMNFNISAGVGFISLFGVAVMSGVLFIFNFRRREKANPANLENEIMTGAIEEFRPVLMMMTVAILGLMPAALATGIGSDVQRPMATVIVGGLCSATLLSLFGLPLIFLKSRKSQVLIEKYDVEERVGGLEENGKRQRR